MGRGIPGGETRARKGGMDEFREGVEAPDFTLPASGGQSISLHDLRGKKLILYFYPNDDTPGCTKEACQFRDLFPDFSASGATVLGISPNDSGSHDRFVAKYGLPFTLLADPGHKIAHRYGVWKQKSNYGRKYMGIERSTFLIDEDGIIQRVWRNVRANGHAQRVLEAIQV
jgi:peroxiredoxin Q/BCP